MTSSSPYPAEPIHDVAEFASFELFSPCVDETLWFFKDLLGMTETARSGNSVFLRGWEDSYKHSLKITEREEPGMGYAGWRAMSPQALDRRVAAITDAGLGRGWVEGEVGMGPAFEFTTPDGSIQRLNWEVDYYRAEPDNQSVLLNRRQRRPLTGVPLKHLDHINMLAKNVTDNKNFAANVLGFKLSEHIVMSDNIEGGAWLRLQTRSHDVAFTKDATGEGGRLHHVAFAYGTTQHLEDAADVLIDNGLEIEAGIARHGISQAQFLYVLEPGGTASSSWASSVTRCSIRHGSRSLGARTRSTARSSGRARRCRPNSTHTARRTTTRPTTARQTGTSRPKRSCCSAALRRQAPRCLMSNCPADLGRAS